jgi:hypothetical protein
MVGIELIGVIAAGRPVSGVVGIVLICVMIQLLLCVGVSGYVVVAS